MDNTCVHIVWGELAVSLYRRGVIDNTVRLAHAVYDFHNPREAAAFIYGISESRRSHEWIQVKNIADIRRLGMPLRSKLIEAIVRGDVETVKEMLDAGVDVNTRAHNGMTALQVAAKEGQDKVAEVLLDRGAQMEEPQESLYPYNAVHLAATSSKPNAGKVIDVLAERQAELDRQDRDGKTALMKAIESSRLDQAKRLIDNGARVDIEDNMGRTARQMFDRLHGADVNNPQANALHEAMAKAEREALERQQRLGSITRHPTPWMKPGAHPGDPR